MRTIGHAICASSAKFGALLAALLFAYLQSNIARLYIFAYVSFLGLLFTIIFIPEITTLSIRENDAYWKCLIEKNENYNGDYL